MTEAQQRIRKAIYTNDISDVPEVLRRRAYPCACGCRNREEAQKEPCLCSAVFYEDLADDIEALPAKIERSWINIIAGCKHISSCDELTTPRTIGALFLAGIAALEADDE